MHKIIEGDSCVKVVIDQEIDGNTARQGYKKGEEACS